MPVTNIPSKVPAPPSVEHNERLAIGNPAPGLFDALIGFKSGRSCVVKGIKIEASSVFSIEENDLVSCTK
jgi:hypothetical protein